MKYFATLALIWVVAGTTADAADPVKEPEHLAFFESKIRPVLIRECYGCHSTTTGNAKGGLRLDTRDLVLIGGNSGPAVVPGDVDESLLISAIAYDDFAMPPDGPLSESIVDDFRRWVEMGAPDPRTTEAAQVQSSVSPDDIESFKQSHWSLQPLVSNVPSENDWSQTTIDRFILAKLQDQSLQPADDASASQVLRRLFFALTGLPPTPDQVRQFENAWAIDAEDAVAQWTDELLQQDTFGERWARHWLDVVRYAESNGREVNVTFPHAWRYRDFVIDSLNDDKPYDEFVRQQIAGDLLPVSSDEQWAENLVATTFLALGPKTLSERNGAQFEVDLIDEQIDVTTRVFLGFSVACARCHDHKFEPIAQSDYASLAGVFSSTATFYGTPASQFGNSGGVQNRNNSNLIRFPIDDPNPYDRTYSRDELEDLNEEVRNIRQSLVQSQMEQRRGEASPNAIQNFLRAQASISALSSMIGSVDENGKPISFCMGTQDRSSPRDARILARGEIDQPADVVPRGMPRLFVQSPLSIGKQESGRLQLADWMTSPDNPLTARVMVNRVWQHVIGRGLVATTEDFGSTGTAPTHPELLDHLTIQFIQSGWSIKDLIRQIVTSRVFRISSEYRRDAFEADPDNQWLWRAHPRRLDAEAIRDSMLAAAGQLDLERPRGSEVAKAGYTTVRDGNLINIGQFAMASSMMDADARQSMRSQYARQFGQPGKPLDMIESKIRSVYMPVVRDYVPRSLEVFDFAEPSLIIGQRESSNTADQALYMLNNPFVIAQSQKLARRCLQVRGDVNERIDTAFMYAYSRPPTESERSTVRRGLEQFGQGSSLGSASPLAWAMICQSLLASAEFRYLD